MTAFDIYLRGAVLFSGLLAALSMLESAYTKDAKSAAIYILSAIVYAGTGIYVAIAGAR